MNNFLLFVFRLLTIEYRIKYPMQGKSYHIDDDVSNELMHEIIKGIEMIFKYDWLFLQKPVTINSYKKEWRLFTSKFFMNLSC